MKKEDIFFAITGDIVSSKEISDRDKIQKLLIQTCEEVNKLFTNYIIVNFSITVGDEIQGLIKRNSPVFEIIEYFEKVLFPVKIRFGVGEGGISTSYYSTTTKMDGECFINSRKGIEEGRKEKRLLKIIIKDKKTEQFLDIIILWIEKTKVEWDKIVFRRFYLYKELGSIEKVAQREKVTKQSIGKCLKRAKYDLILKSEMVLAKWISTENG